MNDNHNLVLVDLTNDSDSDDVVCLDPPLSVSKGPPQPETIIIDDSESDQVISTTSSPITIEDSDDEADLVDEEMLECLIEDTDDGVSDELMELVANLADQHHDLQQVIDLQSIGYVVGSSHDVTNVRQVPSVVHHVPSVLLQPPPSPHSPPPHHLWIGSILMQHQLLRPLRGDANGDDAGRDPTAGSSSIMGLPLPNRLQVIGRIQPEVVSYYVRLLLDNPHDYEVRLMRLDAAAASDADAVAYRLLYEYLEKVQRYAVLRPEDENRHRWVKDVYVLGVAANAALPDELQAIVGGAEFRAGDEAVLLGLVVVHRQPQMMVRE